MDAHRSMLIWVAVLTGCVADPAVSTDDVDDGGSGVSADRGPQPSDGREVPPDGAPALADAGDSLPDRRGSEDLDTVAADVPRSPDDVGGPSDAFPERDGPAAAPEHDGPAAAPEHDGPAAVDASPTPDDASPISPDAGPPVPLLVEGELCAEPGVVAACTPGLLCDDFTRETPTCRAEWMGLGEECRDDLRDLERADGWRLGSLDALDRIGGGGTCLGGSACGLSADRDHVCVPTLEVGDPCAVDARGGSCRPGALCNPGDADARCVPLNSLPAGAACVESACGPGLRCLGQAGQSTCEPLEGVIEFGSVGERCPCEVGLLCAPGERGCFAPFVGEAASACEFHEECGPGLRCNHATDQCQAPQSAAEGDPCMGQAFCAPGALCVRDELGHFPGTCRDRLRLGDACGRGLPECQPPLYCIESEGGARCDFPRLWGEACGPGMAGPMCIAPLRCEVPEGANEPVCR